MCRRLDQYTVRQTFFPLKFRCAELKILQSYMKIWDPWKFGEHGGHKSKVRGIGYLGNNKQTNLTIRTYPENKRAWTHSGPIILDWGTEALQGYWTLTWSKCFKLMGYFQMALSQLLSELGTPYFFAKNVNTLYTFSVSVDLKVEHTTLKPRTQRQH